MDSQSVINSFKAKLQKLKNDLEATQKLNNEKNVRHREIEKERETVWDIYRSRFLLYLYIFRFVNK